MVPVVGKSVSTDRNTEVSRPSNLIAGVVFEKSVSFMIWLAIMFNDNSQPSTSVGGDSARSLSIEYLASFILFSTLWWKNAPPPLLSEFHTQARQTSDGFVRYENGVSVEQESAMASIGACPFVDIHQEHCFSVGWLPRDDPEDGSSTADIDYCEGAQTDPPIQREYV